MRAKWDLVSFLGSYNALIEDIREEARDATPRPSWRRLAGGGHGATITPLLNPHLRPASSSTSSHSSFFVRLLLNDGKKKKRRNGRVVSGCSGVVLSFCSVGGRRGRLGRKPGRVAAHKHKACLCDSPILSPQGQRKKLHVTAIRYSSSPPSPSILGAAGGDGRRRDGSRRDNHGP